MGFIKVLILLLLILHHLPPQPVLLSISNWAVAFLKAAHVDVRGVHRVRIFLSELRFKSHRRRHGSCIHIRSFLHYPICDGLILLAKCAAILTDCSLSWLEVRCCGNLLLPDDV